MSLITKPKTLSNGTVAQATDVESNFSTIYNDYNGNIDNTNLAAGAGIADSKLGQITTYNKVSGAAIGSLASISSAAGVIPAVNVPLLAGLSTASIGAIAYAAANTAITALATGVSGSFLMSTGTTAIPAFATFTRRLLGIDCGVTPSVAGNSTYGVTFNFQFSSAPKVQVTPAAKPGNNSEWYPASVTTAGFTLTTVDNETIAYFWFASLP